MKHYLSTLVAVIALALGMVSMPQSVTAQNAGTFEVGDGTFLLNGKPFVVRAAEIHYPRIPRPYWEHRIKMCKALGMNTICIYIFWNIHEPQPDQFDFSEGNDIAAFCRLAQQNGMYVIVRPGPYVCAEWEMGGLPWWLLQKKDIKLRESDPYFIERVRRFEAKVGEQLAPLTIQNGGPIIMVQVENEYGSYGVNKEYVSTIRDIVRESGFSDVALFQCDWSSNFTNNGLDDLIWTMNFGTGADIDKQFARLKELRPNSPLMCSEFWSGWFDKWGGMHETRPAEDMTDGITQMLDRGISFSLYMTHGGTSFGHWAGANSPGFAPDVTSYDYDAPINEQGAPTPKYYHLRNALSRYVDKPLPKVPAALPTITVPRFSLTEFRPINYGITQTVQHQDIQTIEALGMGWGSVIYTTTLPATESEGELQINEVHDFARVFVDDECIGVLDRRMRDKSISLPKGPAGRKLTILVEAMGRINFGRAIKDFKGITESVQILTKVGAHHAHYDLKQWTISLIPDDYATAKAAFQKEKPTTEAIPQADKSGYYRGTFTLKKTGDTFLNFETFGKGQVYVNGHPMGRIWYIGPQQTLYVPGCWLKKGENEVIVYDVIGSDDPQSEGLASPIIDRLSPTLMVKPATDGSSFDLSKKKPVHTGRFAAGGGWQEARFEKPSKGRFLCIEALNAQDGKELAAIAELYLLDTNGERLSREPWRFLYADSQDLEHGNYGGEKVYDLQESTYWQTAPGKTYPHVLVIDLGREQTVTGLQYLPRMEQQVPGAIKDYKVYLLPMP